MVIFTTTYTCIRNSFVRAENYDYLLINAEPIEFGGQWEVITVDNGAHNVAARKTSY